jgi:two-component system OmpR family response regulator
MNDPPLVLVVDDEESYREALSVALRREGFAVETAADGAEALAQFLAISPDLVLLDVMLPKMSGIDVCRELRSRSGVPIIMVTARAGEIDAVVGLEVGADDYVPKPFSPRELLGRIKAVLRRTSLAPRAADAADVRSFRFAGWRLDTTERELTSPHGQHVQLGGAEYQLLSILLANAPRLLTRARLMELMRGRDFDPLDRSIDVRVSRLRQTLHDDARAPRIIKTVYGEGYVIGVPVERDVP